MLGGGKRIGLRRKGQSKSSSGLTIEPGAKLIVIGTYLDPGDILDTDARAIGISPQHDIARLLRIFELTVRHNWRCDQLTIRVGRRAQNPGRNQDVLLAKDRKSVV